MPGSAFYAAISGLKSQQIKLDVIANNIANLNTFGFKSSRVAFSDLLSQTLRAASAPQGGRGGTNPIQIGLGVQLAAIDNIMSQGSIQTTGNLTDLAINGEGLFVLYDGASTAYTRAGNFTLDASGTLTGANGMRVQGYTQLNDDGITIDTSTTLSDIQVNFGEKLPGRATSFVNYRSNLDSSSFTFGSAELQAAGSTGLTIASGIAVPIASFAGAQVSTVPFAGPDDTPAPGDADLVINGQSIIFTFPGGFSFTNPTVTAQYVADQINDQSTTVYARVGNNGNIVLQNIFGGTGNDIIISSETGWISNIGLTAGTFVAPAADSSLAGVHTITITEAIAATGTSSIPVAGGLLAADTITIQGTTGPVVIAYGPSAGASSTSAQNAQMIADAINAENAGNPNFFISATANANGTITLTSDLAGKANEIIIIDPGTNPTGLDTIGTFDGANYVVDNGTDASATNVFLSDDGTVTWSRIFTDESVFGIASSIENLEPLILGENPPLPLIPGVTLTAEMLSPGQATVITHDAFEHQTSINVFDSQGNAHQFTITFKHVGSNQWAWTATLPDEPQYTLNNNTGVIEFGPSGLITSSNPTVPITFQPPGVDLVSFFPFFDGMGSPIDGVTQYASDSTTAAESQDGFPLGVLQAFAFDPSGTLQGVYSNGLNRPLARLALAVFANPSGMQRTGNNTWVSTANSGLARVTAARTGGAGEIIGGSLEQSNVDAATEFTELIIAQRSFQAASRIITAQDSILQEVVNLVR
jgi:flagellar hook protein FlgE